MASDLPDFEAICGAADRLAGVARRTPLLRLENPPAKAAAAWVKVEPLQVSGSFKFRGAFNRLSQLTPAERRAGVVAWSSGNHAQGISAAAARLGVAATIVMPADAPQIKIDNTRRYGGDIVFYDRASESREDIARAICANSGAVLVPSYDDPDIIADQGTLGLEMCKQLEDAGEQVDTLLVCCGGGGLIAGVSLAFERLSPATQIYAVEPGGYDDHARSLQQGERVANQAQAESLCDALLAPTPGELTWQINERRLAGGLVVNDQEVCAAMRFAARELKVVAEPGGAAALAALLAEKLDFTGQRVGVVITGGNVDPDVFSNAITDLPRPQARPGRTTPD
jgi:threonine dehydratase